jgi:N-acetylglucosaminyldiphosphoundecaprenol N-acetyl-beta-D-mannosaminyltransferase
MDETVSWIANRVEAHEFTQHVVVNVAKLVNMQTDRELAESVRACDIVNIDGMGVVWAARLLGADVPERVAGIDLFGRLLALAAQRGFPVFLLGAKPEIVAEVAARSVAAYPGLNIAGIHHGYFSDDERAVVEHIRRSGARMLFVAMTSPKKENFINRWRDELGVDFVMGVGGTFDVVAGKVRRAPRWMQQAGMEWLYRVLQEPRRMWKRYLVTNSRFALMLTAAWLQRRLQHKTNAS